LSSSSKPNDWSREVGAVFRKEARTELRSKSGLVTSALFSSVTVISIAFALFNRNVNAKGSGMPDVCAALVWLVILFSSLLSLPRTFVTEEEQGTADILRLTARPHAVYWGKVLFNIAQVMVTALFVSVLFIGMTGIRVHIPWLYGVGLIGGSSAIAAAVTLCGAIAAPAANRTALAAAVAVPLLLPLVAIGVSVMRVAFGAGFVEGGVQAAVGIVGFATLMLAIGPWVYAAIWKS